mgnify:CR=1 FL=1
MVPIVLDEGLRLVRCPVCRLRWTGEEPAAEPCRRCRAELTSLRRACAAAACWQGQARQALAAGQTAAAVRLATAARALLDVPATRATLAAALFARGDHLAAWRLVQRPDSPG